MNILILFILRMLWLGCVLIFIEYVAHRIGTATAQELKKYKEKK